MPPTALTPFIFIMLFVPSGMPPITPKELKAQIS